MERKALEGLEGAKIKLYCKDGIRYTGFLVVLEYTYVELLDKFGLTCRINLDQIDQLIVLEQPPQEVKS